MTFVKGTESKVVVAMPCFTRIVYCSMSTKDASLHGPLTGGNRLPFIFLRCLLSKTEISNMCFSARLAACLVMMKVVIPLRYSARGRTVLLSSPQS
jgi:hypothetical protein